MSTIYIQCDDDWLASCEDCEWTGEAKDLDAITDVQERISAGEIVPAGQCPECGALAQLTDKGCGPVVDAAHNVIPDDFDKRPSDFGPAIRALKKAIEGKWGGLTIELVFGD